MIDKIDEYQNISQIGNALQTLVDGIDEHVNNLQQGVSRSASMTSYTMEHVSNASERLARISHSIDSDDINKKRNKTSLKRKDTANSNQNTGERENRTGTNTIEF